MGAVIGKMICVSLLAAHGVDGTLRGTKVGLGSAAPSTMRKSPRSYNLQEGEPGTPKKPNTKRLNDQDSQNPKADKRPRTDHE